MAKTKTYREVENLLKEHGFELVRKKGSHCMFTKKGCRRPIVVPFHGSGSTISPGVLRTILKELELSKW